MRIITSTCPACETIVSGALLEDERRMDCPGYQCPETRTFEELSEADRQYLREQLATLEGGSDGNYSVSEG